MSDDCLPDCMMPDGGQCCAGYTKQRQRTEALEAALRFYANDKCYDTSDIHVRGYTRPVMQDHGKIARAALAPEKEK